MGLLSKNKNNSVYSHGGQLFFPLVSAGEKLGLAYKKNYLEKMASSGKLKAFRFESEWLTTLDWLWAFHQKVKNLMIKEVNSITAQKDFSIGWSWAFKSALKEYLAGMTLVLAVLSLGIVIGSALGFFFNYQDQTGEILAQVKDFKINDELLTDNWKEFFY